MLLRGERFDVVQHLPQYEHYVEEMSEVEEREVSIPVPGKDFVTLYHLQ
jgi:hypothetical protein